MPTYLHKPITSLDEIEALFPDEATNRPGTPERVNLEFKAKLWEPLLPPQSKKPQFNLWEFGKDVVAMMNAVGGDIVVGVDEKDAAAERWFPLTKGPAKHGANYTDNQLASLEAHLGNLLDPREAAQHVRFTPLRDTDGGRSALVVTIEPFAYGPVSVRCAKQADKTAAHGEFVAHVYPRRDDNKVIYMEQAEVARMMNPNFRSAFLTITRALTENEHMPVRICSSKFVDAATVRTPLSPSIKSPIDGFVLTVQDNLLKTLLDPLTAEASLCRKIVMDTIKDPAGNSEPSERSPGTLQDRIAARQASEAVTSHDEIIELLQFGMDVYTNRHSSEDDIDWQPAGMWIPINLIRTAWVANVPIKTEVKSPVAPKAPTPVLHIDLNAHLVFSEGRWRIDT